MEASEEIVKGDTSSYINKYRDSSQDEVCNRGDILKENLLETSNNLCGWVDKRPH